MKGLGPGVIVCSMRLKMKSCAFALLLVSTSVAAQDLSVPNPPARAAQLPVQAAQRRCLAQAGRPEKYLLDRNLSIEIYRYFDPQPENNCTDKVGYVTAPQITSEQRNDPQGHPYIVQSFHFYADQKSLGREFALIRLIDPKAIPGLEYSLGTMDEAVSQMKGNRSASNGDPDDEAKYDLRSYGPWQVESDRRFNVGGVSWLPAREVVYVRNPPPPPPDDGTSHNPQYPIHMRFRKIVDTCNNQVYVLRSAERDDDWINTFQVSCNK